MQLTQELAKTLIIEIFDRIKRSYVVHGLRISNVFRKIDSRGKLRVPKAGLYAALNNPKITIQFNPRVHRSRDEAEEVSEMHL